jgi:hypothetical protein
LKFKGDLSILNQILNARTSTNHTKFGQNPLDLHHVTTSSAPHSKNYALFTTGQITAPTRDDVDVVDSQIPGINASDFSLSSGR